MVAFIRALRAAGVRISLAESQDAMYGADAVGVNNKEHFRVALKTTLVKEARDQERFEYYFPLFFGANTPPMQDILSQMSPSDQKMMEQAMQALQGDLRALQQLLQQMMRGQPFSQEQLEQMARQSGLNQANDMYQRQWFERRMQRQAGLQQLQQMIEQLLQRLQEMGMNGEQAQELRQMMQENAQGLADQIAQYAGAQLAEQMAERDPDPKPDLMDVPFSRLGDAEVEAIRSEIRRLAARLRSRASLRQRRAKAGTPDPRRTMRANMKYQGTPMELKYRRRHVKPCLVVICDVSTSVRYCAEFLLTLIYELQDQVARTNSYIFISDLTDISMVFKEYEPQEAVQRVLEDNRPGYYNTDLGRSLETFRQEHYGLVTSKTTVIILGDGRNNYNDPRADIVQEMQRRSRRLLWFNPENPGLWGTGDSDMLQYVPVSDSVYYVNNLRDLANAVDKILTDG
ncbi:MAG: VWA domain-containing protein [Chloroflexi bacterium]|nr:VWA domain-containing protein [Chloroflexota bacterium]